MENPHNQPFRLLEDDIKALLIEHLMLKGGVSKHDCIISEFNVDNSSRRVDLVVAGKDGLYAYEIKSEADSLHRLRGQIETYSQFFDKTVVIAAPKHISNILEIVPKDTAVWVITHESIKVVQRGQKRRGTPISFLQLMNTNELRRLATKSRSSLESKRRADLELSAKTLPRETIRMAVITAIQNRYAVSTQHFWNVVGGASVCAENIGELSPYLIEKRRQKQLEDERKAFWARWSRQASLLDDPFLMQLYNEKKADLFGYVPSHIREMMAA